MEKNKAGENEGFFTAAMEEEIQRVAGEDDRPFAANVEELQRNRLVG